ncbi:MAG: nucleoside hydrolase [Caldilineales bacterium]|nr:nucleoside hydrolase [Caldilineales bacterium]MCW5859018.1 nucleoside hydrolase [Caldilineales bacterium]
MRHFIIDTDTASDDAVAILMALQWPDVIVDAITIVSGNMPVAQGSINARYVVELCGQETPVYEGCTRPLLRQPFHAYYFHGPDGMGGMNYPPPRRSPAPGHAVLQLVERFAAAPGEITLVTLGPLTNIALALRLEPRLAGWVKGCVVMGGAANVVGNVTPAAEYNIWCDPEAAGIVFQSGMPVVMVGWEVSRGEANLSLSEIEAILEMGTPRAKFAIECNRHALAASLNLQSDPGLGLPDPVAMAVALDPSICTRRSRHFVAVSGDELTRGMTVVDELRVTSTPPYRDPYWGPQESAIDVCWTIDVGRWKEMLRRTLTP